MGNGWSYYGIDHQVSITGPQPWDVAYKNKHHQGCVVHPTTLRGHPCRHASILLSGIGAMEPQLCSTGTAGEDEGGCCSEF